MYGSKGLALGGVNGHHCHLHMANLVTRMPGVRSCAASGGFTAPARQASAVIVGDQTAT